MIVKESSIVNDVYQQFIDYYGEDRVDLQTYRAGLLNLDVPNIRTGDNVILVHWPSVTISNEYDESVEIWDLYAATVIRQSGKLVNQVVFNRSTYDKIQWVSDYAHKM